MPKIYDRENQERDEAWLRTTYGNVQIHKATVTDGLPCFRVVELREKVGPAAVVVKVLGTEGEPLKGIPVLRHWPTAPGLPDWTPPPERWRGSGVVGKTGDGGDTGFGMGQGDYYDPVSQEGASAIFLGQPRTHSELVTGLGMLKATEHAHLDLTLQLVEGEEPGPGPGPEGSELARMAEALEIIAAAVETFAVWLLR